MEEICGHAKVKKGSFYYFFRSKRDLALAALDYRWAIARDHLVEPILRGSAPPLDRIRDFFEAIGSASVQEKARDGRCGGCAFGNMAAEMASHDEKIRLRVRQVFEDIAACIEEALAEARRRGDAPGIDPAENARALVAYMEGLLLLARTYDDPSILTRLGPQAVALARAPHRRRAKKGRSRT